jgi:TorA maturation chaperone TorD
MAGANHLDRAQVYRCLARTFRCPDRSLYAQICDEDLPRLPAALARLGGDVKLVELCEAFVACMLDVECAALGHAYMRTFEPSNGAERPPNETAHAPETPQEGLTRNHELADIAGFYRAFGVEVTPGLERVDHIAVELEFLHLLAVKAALARESGATEHAEICRDAAAAFLHDHLGRWCDKFSTWLDANARADVYRLAGQVLAAFIKLDSGVAAA